MQPSELVILFDRGLAVLGMNSAAATLVGAGDPASTFHDVLDAAAEALRTGRLPLALTVTVAASSGPADLDVQLSLAGDTVVLTARDAAERRALRRAADRAEQAEVAANARLGELDRARDQFLDLAAHELRSPLAAIHGFASLLRSSSSPVRVEDLSERILVRTAQLTLLVDRVVTFSRLNAGRVDVIPDDVDAADVVIAVADGFRTRLMDRQLHVDVEAGVHMRTDSELLTTVLAQLVDNAIVYTVGRATIRIEVHRDDDRVVFAVQDDGPGIDDDERALVFERFQRGAHALRLGVTGLGIGLPIVQAAVSLLHGDVELHSQPGEGTRVEVSLPLGTPAHAPAPG